MNLADDPKTLSMMDEATFRQKGEALYSQFLSYMPEQLRVMAQWQAQARTNAFAGLFGGIGSAGIYGGQS